MLGLMMALLRILHLHSRRRKLALNDFSLFDSWPTFVEILGNCRHWLTANLMLCYLIICRHRATSDRQICLNTQFQENVILLLRPLFHSRLPQISPKTDPPVSLRNKPRPTSYTSPQNSKFINSFIYSNLPICSNWIVQHTLLIHHIIINQPAGLGEAAFDQPASGRPALTHIGTAWTLLAPRQLVLFQSLAKN